MADARSTDKVIGDLLDACGAATDIVARGKAAWDQDRVLRLAGEAVINRIGDASSKLPSEIRDAMPLVPWDDIRANRVLVAHVYHRIDENVLWFTLSRDVPRLAMGSGVGSRGPISGRRRDRSETPASAWVYSLKLAEPAG